MVFSKKWLQNHLKFLLHFLTHIDVLKLCSKFELIPTSIFRVTAILRKHRNSKKSLYYSLKMAPCTVHVSSSSLLLLLFIFPETDP